MAQLRTSSIPYVKKALVNPSQTDPTASDAGLFRRTLATASVAGSGSAAGGPVQVLYGWTAQLDNDAVVVGGTEAPSTQDWAILGDDRAQIDEAYRIACDVVSMRSESQQEATERAFAILALLETAIRPTTPVNGGVLGLHGSGDGQFMFLLPRVTGPHLREMAAKGGFIAHIEWALLIECRI